jgi:hypothetical protein
MPYRSGSVTRAYSSSRGEAIPGCGLGQEGMPRREADEAVIAHRHLRLQLAQPHHPHDDMAPALPTLGKASLDGVEDIDGRDNRTLGRRRAGCIRCAIMQ